ncbi:uncharacterized protein N0V96_005914 [Colletotrichum fioriniae]|uniref:uncharacterized protein n=1 Tax=Colletotrichum fioriniae TaxID=710243 RepID=UPI0023003685|nr:uncharacterized protein COL516b_002437 [Colletotrichum fioriniae]KAJ0309935.1 hypothetical protein COL516b_002437 [Colletotrichum fioriniae]KAJ3944384.1 hypothetical protein N0V96_005914 [Colletotrichum fioriniae]
MPPLRPWGPIFEEITLPQNRMSSTVFSMLPTSLQSRLPPLRSIRKSASMQTLTSSRQSHTRTLSGLDDGVHRNITQARLVSESTEEQHMSLVATEHRTYEVRSAAEKHEQQQRQQAEQYYQQQQQQAPSQCSNVDWRFAQQGLALIAVAQDELRHPSRRPAVDFERKAFLDGVEYILKALPNDLNEHELHRLRTSTPPNFIPPPSPGGRTYSPSRGANNGRSILHRGVQIAVVNIFILIHLALPYIILMLRLAARTEREYRISENLVGAGMGLANAIGSKGMRITGALYNVGDGRLGQALTEAVAWTVEGLTGGLSDGVGEGLSIVAPKRQ